MLAGSTAQRNLGAFYTPPAVAAHMTRMLRVNRRSRILEPAGGDGAFVTPLLRSGTVTPEQITV